MSTHSGKRIGVLGGSSPIGAQLINLLVAEGVSVVALSRSRQTERSDGVRWVTLDTRDESGTDNGTLVNIDLWISVAPIWALRQHFPLLLNAGVKKIVALSSTSRFTKTATSNTHEVKVVNDLITGERDLEHWATLNNFQWVVLRPTLIYGRSTDRNLSEIVRMIRKFKFFPLLGSGNGLRQPIYVDDVAQACILAAYSTNANNKAYNISGSEVITYREMVARIFGAMGLTPKFIRINFGFFKIAISILRIFPRYRHWSFDMADRMSKDMVFDHNEAERDFGFSPQKFRLQQRDVL